MKGINFKKTMEGMTESVKAGMKTNNWTKLKDYLKKNKMKGKIVRMTKSII